MRWLLPIFATFALAVFGLSIPVSAPGLSTQAEASRMDGKGNCAGGVCTQNRRGPPSAKKSKKS